MIIFKSAMPLCEVVYYCESDGSSPVVIWLARLVARDPAAATKCLSAIRRLATWGHELRRPVADFLRDGIYQLRIRCGRVHIRFLYFFSGKNQAVICHAFTKEGAVPAVEVNRALERRKAFAAAPSLHTYQESEGDPHENHE